MPQSFCVNPNSLKVIRGLLQMHELSANGQFESPEAVAIRDAMDIPWEGLSEIERKRIGGLSEDLNALSEITSSYVPLAMTPEAQGALLQTFEARQRGEWDKALDLVRHWGKCLPAAMLCYLRGTIWHAAGAAEVAAVFLDHALRLEPENGDFQAELLEALKTAVPMEAALRTVQSLPH